MKNHSTLIWRLVAVALGLLAVSAAGAQTARTAALHADFSANPISGCSPLVVTFSDHSSGNPTQWRWELGNGVVSTQQNPSTIYVTPGTYTVRLRIQNAQGADSLVRNAYITVNEAPVPAFGSPVLGGCAPFGSTFTDSSTSTLPLLERRWDFGDGSLGDGVNATHNYSAPGQYSVSLRLTNSAGCTKTLTRNHYINVSGRPNAAFSNSNPAHCSVPFSVQFDATATSGATSYAWDFGDGGTASTVQASHSYTTAGAYTVTLIVTNASGCRDTLRRTALVQVGASAAFFAPDTVCAHAPVAFVNQSNPIAPLTTWLFGDGSSSAEASPVKRFDTPGVYTVKLRNQYAGCADSVTHQVVVRPGPQAIFETVDTFSCTAPFTAHFRNGSTGAASYRWEFGDGSISSDAAPAHTYTQTGIYTVRLIATGTNGCADTLTRSSYVRVQAPRLSFSGLPVSGCAPQLAQLSAAISEGSIMSYHWNFGDGTGSVDAAPSHAFPLPGQYTVSLSVTTASGCSVTDSVPAGVSVFRKPTASFDLSPGDVCAMQGIQFTNTSTNVDSNATWYWSFGDGGYSTAPDPYHEYDAVGWFSVQLVASNGTCRDTSNRPNVLFVRPPVARFLVSFQCGAPFTRQFDNRSIGAQTSSWDFGDGSTSTETSPVHTYAAPGSYVVKLRVTNDTCYHTRTITVDVYNEKARFRAADSSLCYGQAYSVSAYDFNAAHIRAWSWDFGDGNAPETTVAAATHVYTRPGTYTVTLTITDPLGCTSSFTQTVTVRGAIADFEHSGAAACLTGAGAPVEFTDRSVADGNNPIVQWLWDFGDGTRDSSGAGPLQHRYAATGTYTATLRVTDASGCFGYYGGPAPVHVSRPTASFTSTDTLTCTDRPVHFQNASVGEGSLTFSWGFGDGQASTAAAPVHAYGSTGIYTVVLRVTDGQGCSDSLQRPALIRISYPKAGFTLSDSTASCPPMLVRFTNISTDFTDQQWDFGNGNSSGLAAPAHLYNEAGVFRPRLIVTGPGGCQDTVSRTVRLDGPRGQIDYSPLAGCSPLTVHLQARTQARDSLIWDFGDGNILPGRDSVLQHVFTDTGRFVPRAILVDSRGCSVPVTGRDTVHAWVPAVRAGNGFVHCPGQPRPLSVTGAVTYSWEPSPYLSCLSCASPLANPTVPTTFVVTGKDAFGCTARDSVRVALQRPFHLTPPLRGDSLCAGGAVLLRAGGAASYSWSPAAGLDNPTAAQTVARPAASTVYRVIGRDSINCYSDSAFVNITVFPVPQVNAGADLTLRAGDTARLQVQSSPDITGWQWSPTGGLSCSTCPAPVVHAAQNTRYQVQVVNAGGCTARDAVNVSVLCDGGNLFIPNTFSPNGDGANDRFFPRGTGLYSVRSIRIFNRWGELVFERLNAKANDPAAGWDGTFRGAPAPSDVYIYTCEIVCSNSTVLPVKGDVTLLR
ncbi:PKD domain-containing protein [Flaviaesturariibacter terrae]